MKGVQWNDTKTGDAYTEFTKNKFPDHFYTEPDIRTALNEISQRGSKMQLSKIIKEATDLSKKIGFDLNIRTVKEAVKTNNKEVLKKFLHQYRDLCFANAAWGAHTQGKKVVLILGYNHGKSPVIRHILEKINTIQEQEEKVEL